MVICFKQASTEFQDSDPQIEIFVNKNIDGAHTTKRNGIA